MAFDALVKAGTDELCLGVKSSRYFTAQNLMLVPPSLGHAAHDKDGSPIPQLIVRKNPSGWISVRLIERRRVDIA